MDTPQADLLTILGRMCDCRWVLPNEIDFHPIYKRTKEGRPPERQVSEPIRVESIGTSVNTLTKHQSVLLGSEVSHSILQRIQEFV